MAARQGDRLAAGSDTPGYLLGAPAKGTALGHQHRYRTAAVLRRTEQRREQGCSWSLTCAGQSPSL